MKIYLAGPMRGFPLYNFPAFDNYAAYLRRLGHEVVSPAEIDREVGFNEHTDTATPEFMRKCFARDAQEIAGCDGIALMPMWGQSAGARWELDLALMLGLEVLDATDGSKIDISKKPLMWPEIYDISDAERSSA